ncbi:MAG: hypothetical protein U9N87_07315 [Planctomycetota bacterium]|nr:hypothetical protein [Planctomycetota bacterium]
MNSGQTAAAQHETWPRVWRLFVVAMGTLILCACRAPMHTAVMDSSCPSQGCIGAGSPALPCPGQVYTPEMMACPPEMGQRQCPPAMPVAGMPRTGKCRRCANDEFLIDGGDMHPEVRVRDDWEVLGLTPEETVAHFDTLDGRTLVEPSNRVCIYAPRFRAVRKIEGIVQNEQTDQLGDINKPVQLVRCDEIIEPISSKQQVEPVRDTVDQPPLAFISKQGDGAMSVVVGPLSFQDAFQPYENIDIIRTGEADLSESAWLAKGADAAITWSYDQAVQIILDKQTAQTDVGVQKAQVTYTVDMPPANPKLRLVKIASTKTAKPGETVDFTLRFDNVGNQLIGNVTIIDNLTTRLEYVADSAQCSLPGKFIVKKNDVGSDILRWELKDPLNKGKGGIIRFKCRVR